jgi:hypothetical protein
VGIEPTASLVLSQGGLPVAYRAMCLLCPKQESNLQSLGFKPSRSASWRIRAQVVPDGLEPPLPGCGPGVVAARPRDCLIGAEAARLELATVLPAPVFKTGSSSGRMTSVKFRGLESNQRPPGSEPGVTTSSNCPGSHLHKRHAALVAVRGQVQGAGLEPASPGSKPGSLPLADPRMNESALRESNPPRQVGSLAPLPLGQGHKAAAAGIEPASGRLTVAYPYQHGSHRNISRRGWSRTSIFVLPKHVDFPSLPHAEK